MRRSLTVALAAVIACALAASLAQAADPIYVRNPLTNHLAQRPSTLNFNDVDLTGLHWIHWGWSRAIAHGNANVLICDPSCAGGHRERGTVRIVLSQRVREGKRRLYQCISGKVSGVPAAYSRISWQCNVR